MYTKQRPNKTSIIAIMNIEGETIEEKVRRIANNKEPILDNAEMVYTERKNGVDQATDIRTDKWLVAVEAMDKVNQAKQSTIKDREAEKEKKKIAKEAKENMGKEGEQSTQNN